MDPTDTPDDETAATSEPDDESATSEPAGPGAEATLPAGAALPREAAGTSAGTAGSRVTGGGGRGGRGARHRRHGVWSSRLLIGAGLALLLAAGGWQGYVWLWNNHLHRVGGALIAKQQQHDRAATAAGLPACGPQASGATSAPAASAPATSTAGAGPAGAAVAATAQLPAGSRGATGPGSTSSDPVHGLLAVPRLGLLAPVEEGVGNAQLAVAVGHIPASVWPGSAGTSILAAHDVSYFVHIDQLQPGNVVEYATPCTTYEFTVSGHQVVKQGSPVYNSPGPTLMLETCWPTDALWYTPDRLLVTATLTGTVSTATQAWARSGGVLAGGSAAGAPHGTSAGAGPTLAAPTVPAPKALAAEGLTLATNSIPMGTLTIAGTPTTAWTQSPGPLGVESSALQAFIGGLKAAEQQVPSWWSAVAPGVAMPAALGGARISDWHQGLDVAITAAGTEATAVTLSSIVTVAGGPSPGTYDQVVHETIGGGELTVAGWQILPYQG